MELSDLIKVVDFNESIIVEVNNYWEDTYMIIEEPYEIELIANGYRPSFDMAPRHKILFKGVRLDVEFKGYEPVLEYDTKDGLYIKTKTLSLKIKNVDVELTPNYDFDNR